MVFVSEFLHYHQPYLFAKTKGLLGFLVLFHSLCLLSYYIWLLDEDLQLDVWLLGVSSLPQSPPWRVQFSCSVQTPSELTQRSLTAQAGILQ